MSLRTFTTRRQKKFEAVTDGRSFKFLDCDHVQIWRCLETFYEDGRAKAIGLANFNKMQLQHILDRCAIWPYVLEVESHLYWQQDELVEFCDTNRIVFTAYAPLGSPGRKVCDPASFWPEGEPLNDPLVIELTKKYNKTPAQILLRFLTQRGLCAIAKSTNPDHLKENFNIFDFKISDDDMKELRKVPTKTRLFLLEWFFKSQHYPFEEVDKTEITRLMGHEGQETS